jgi:hypothetical protein
LADAEADFFMQPTSKPSMSRLKPPTYGIPVNKIQASTGRTQSDAVHTSDIGFIQNAKPLFVRFSFGFLRIKQTNKGILLAIVTIALPIYFNNRHFEYLALTFESCAPRAPEH